MFKNKTLIKNGVDYKYTNYKLKDRYKTDDLVIGNLEYISSLSTPNGPIIETTEQKYIFLKFKDKDKTRYVEIFTGLIVDSDISCYFDLPYIVNIESLKDNIKDISDEIAKYGLLLILNEINKKHEKEKIKK